MGSNREPSIAELLVALERVTALLEGVASRLNATAADELVSKAQVARALGVSTRWVERHVAPVMQPSRGGRAWYSRASIESQLSLTRRSSSDETHARRNARARSASVRDSRAKEIEVELRRDMERRR